MSEESACALPNITLQCLVHPVSIHQESVEWHAFMRQLLVTAWIVSAVRFLGR